MSRYKKTFEMLDTEAEAIEFCSRFNKEASYYVRKNHAAYYTAWESAGGESKFVVWYVTK